MAVDSGAHQQEGARPRRFSKGIEIGDRFQNTLLQDRGDRHRDTQFELWSVDVTEILKRDDHLATSSRV
jgi:hypothetical protein